VIGLKARRVCALIVGSLPLPLGMEGLTRALVIMVDGVGVDVANQPLVKEK
jgi:hypothetical protein